MMRGCWELCLWLLQLVMGVLCWALFLICFSSAIVLTRKGAGRSLLLYCSNVCSVALPYTAVGQSGGCDCDLSWLYSLIERDVC